MEKSRIRNLAHRSHFVAGWSGGGAQGSRRRYQDQSQTTQRYLKNIKETIHLFTKTVYQNPLEVVSANIYTMADVPDVILAIFY